MSIDAITITPNPCNVQQSFVISCEVSPEEIPTPSTDYKMPTVVVYSSESYGSSGLLDTSTKFGHYVANSSKTSGAAFILRGFKFPDLIEKTIVGVQGMICYENYTNYANSPLGYFSMQLVTGLTDGSGNFTKIGSPLPISVKKTGSFAEYESEIIEDSETLNWLNSNLTAVIKGTNDFGVRGFFRFSDIAYFKLKFYYL